MLPTHLLGKVHLHLLQQYGFSLSFTFFLVLLLAFSFHLDRHAAN